jgi:hypothetical protein
MTPRKFIVVMRLRGEEAAVVRALRLLLKRLLRDHGVRCERIEMNKATAPTKGA